MDAQDFRGLQEAYLEVVMGEGVANGPYDRAQTDRGNAYGRASTNRGNFYGRAQEKKKPLEKPLEKKKKRPFYYDEQNDIYDIILTHLLDEGYAETVEAAEVIMVNMSEEWREDIMEGMTMKDFMANRRKNERRAASADAKSRGHVDKFTGKPYSTDEARSRRKGIHTPAAAPSRDAARDAAGGETGRGGRLRPNKVRRARAMGEY
jgi:hypothetical protein